MRIAQNLYEGIELGDQGAVGLITYMRTDSVTVAKDAQQSAMEHITENYGKEYAPAKVPIYKTKSKSAQEAHEAIRPTSVTNTPKAVKAFLNRDQNRLYKLIWERFVASQMSPAVYDTMRVDVKAGESRLIPSKRPYDFRASGSSLRFPGFLVLYEESKPANVSEDGNGQIPSELKQQENLDNLGLISEQHFTQPPPRFSEASLVSELDDNGIGRPSTYASIISTILARGYVEKEERRLVPTEIGYIVTDLLVEYFPDVMSVDFTARMETELDYISGGAPWVPVVDSFYKQFANRLEVADKSIEKIEVNRELELVGRDCPLCGNQLVYREGRYGRFIGCSTFPKCRHTEQIINKIGIKCPLDGDDGGEIIELTNRKGRPYYGCLNYPDCKWRSWKRPLTKPCPNCGNLLVRKNKKLAECTVCGEQYPAERFEIEAGENVAV
jgi:DNA topoisomerase-1